MNEIIRLLNTHTPIILWNYTRDQVKCRRWNNKRIRSVARDYSVIGWISALFSLFWLLVKFLSFCVLLEIVLDIRVIFTHFLHSIFPFHTISPKIKCFWFLFYVYVASLMCRETRKHLNNNDYSNNNSISNIPKFAVCVCCCVCLTLYTDFYVVSSEIWF